MAGTPLAITAAVVLALPAAAAEPFGFSDQDRADVNCLAASSIALGNSISSGAPDSAETVGITTVLTYFLGKLKGRHADLRVADVLTPAVLQALSPILATEAQRCGAEAILISGELEQAGKLLTAAENAAATRRNGT
ncbi:MAG: hypothetical protein JHD35_13250 [Sphingopyxis sp.]|nr:hypothetical protein [Sphingopyxis sp.]